jgi:hypothetical protein
MGEIDLGLDLIPIGAAGPRRSAGAMSLAGPAQLSPHFVRFMVFQGAGMGLLLGDPDFSKYIKNGLAFNFQFPG